VPRTAPSITTNGQARGESDREFLVGYRHRVRFTSDAFSPDNPLLAEVVKREDGAVARAMVFIDSGVADAWPKLRKQIADYFAAHDATMALSSGPSQAIQIVPGGEVAKNDRAIFETLTQAIHDGALCRKSYVIAIGGGAVLDAVGFAAAIVHRGVRLVRVPTTTLAQDDAAVGVKNGINAFGKKNFLGCFAPPWAVINDERFLTTLSDRDWRSGLSEAVKVALVKDAKFFDQIARSIDRLRLRDHDAAAPIIQRSAELHLNHIVDGGDPFELNEARPLDFGHWAAHKLEQMTDFQLRHGEAVAIGIALDVQYSALADLLPTDRVEPIHACLRNLGFELWDDALDDTVTLLAGLEEFREHLGGRLTIALLRDIGQAVDVHQIDPRLMIAAIEHLGASVR
jgi:3-dehydroquinate synthase